MRILGIDYGQRRIGLAISDESRKLAFPFDVLKKVPSRKVGQLGQYKTLPEHWNKEEIKAISREIKRICLVEKVKQIVVGLPLDLSGKETAMTKEVKEFATVLKRIVKKPVVFEKEFLTTKLAEQKLKEARVKKIKEKIDAVAAAEILQSHLDKIKS